MFLGISLFLIDIKERGDSEVLYATERYRKSEQGRLRKYQFNIGLIFLLLIGLLNLNFTKINLHLKITEILVFGTQNPNVMDIENGCSMS
jgi:hypothetical protein